MNDRTVPPEFCSAPWKLLHVSPQGEVFSCYESTVSLGNVHDESLQSIWEGSNFVALRQKMLSGERVAACEKCHIKAGAIEGRSLRTLINEQTGATSELFQEKLTKPPLQPTILDLSFSNNCNLKCRMCSSIYSKAWIEDEARAFGSTRGQARELSEQQLNEEIFPLLKTSVRKLVLAGGEPLLDRRNKTMLRFLIDNDRRDMELEYNTNGTVLDEETSALWREFPRLRLAISVDASGRRFEYLRKGAKWSRLVENAAKLRAKVPHAILECYSTVSIFNVISHPEFMREILEQGVFRLEEMNLHYLVEPAHLSVQALPMEMKAEIETKYFAFIQSELLAKHDFEPAKKMILQIKMLLNYMKSENTNRMADFVGAVEKMDGVRGESFREIFPELARF